MRVRLTSRHFKAQDSLHEYARQAVDSLSKYYDGILSADVVLSHENSRRSLKVAELKVSVYGAVLTGIAKSDEFMKSMDQAAEKVLVQLKKYKERLHHKDRRVVRSLRLKV